MAGAFGSGLDGGLADWMFAFPLGIGWLVCLSILFPAHFVVRLYVLLGFVNYFLAYLHYFSSSFILVSLNLNAIM